jgi:hypothetical protein
VNIEARCYESTTQRDLRLWMYFNMAPPLTGHIPRFIFCRLTHGGNMCRLYDLCPSPHALLLLGQPCLAFSWTTPNSDPCMFWAGLLAIAHKPYWNTLAHAHTSDYTFHSWVLKVLLNVLQYGVILCGDDIPIRSHICRSRSVWYCYHIRTYWIRTSKVMLLSGVSAHQCRLTRCSNMAYPITPGIEPERP